MVLENLYLLQHNNKFYFPFSFRPEKLKVAEEKFLRYILARSKKILIDHLSGRYTLQLPPAQFFHLCFRYTQAHSQRKVSSNPQILNIKR